MAPASSNLEHNAPSAPSARSPRVVLISSLLLNVVVLFALCSSSHDGPGTAGSAPSLDGHGATRLGERRQLTKSTNEEAKATTEMQHWKSVLASNGGCVQTTNHQPPTTNHQPPTTNHHAPCTIPRTRRVITCVTKPDRALLNLSHRRHRTSGWKPGMGVHNHGGKGGEKVTDRSFLDGAEPVVPIVSEVGRS